MDAAADVAHAAHADSTTRTPARGGARTPARGSGGRACTAALDLAAIELGAILHSPRRPVGILHIGPRNLVLTSDLGPTRLPVWISIHEACIAVQIGPQVHDWWTDAARFEGAATRQDLAATAAVVARWLTLEVSSARRGKYVQGSNDLDDGDRRRRRRSDAGAGDDSGGDDEDESAETIDARAAVAQLIADWRADQRRQAAGIARGDDDG